jgi:hypothetical protein
MKSLFRSLLLVILLLPSFYLSAQEQKGYYDSGELEYVGFFEGGQINGYGINYFSTGEAAQEGLWVNSELQAGTEIKLAYGNCVSGHCINGYGIAISEYDNNTGATRGKKPFFRRYEGTWRNGEKDGVGVEIDKDGNTYVGEFKDGFMHGKGTMFYSDGTEDAGTWNKSTKVNK